MGKRDRSALLPTNIPQLQNLIKRDPISYKDEFIQQYRHFQAILQIFKLKPDEDSKELADLIGFISQVAQCYPSETAAFPQDLIALLSHNYAMLQPELRRSLVQSVILLRNKGILGSATVLPLFFTLFRCRDRQLRELLYTHIVNDIKNANAKHQNNKLNRSLQGFMFTMLESAKGGNSDENAVAAKRSVDVCVELYRKNVWNDQKTVNVIVEACFSPVTKVAVTAIQFFLGTNDEAGDDSDKEDDVPDLKKMKMAALHTRKTKSKAKKYEKALATVKRKEKQKHKAENFNFSALHLVNDPQSFVEKLFSRCQTKEDRWEVRLMTLNLISRIIGIHKLSMLSFYPYLMKYLQPHQRDVTMVLVCAAQASHDLVPPDVLEPVIKAIANQFVTEHCANEVIAAGINGIREICARAPLAMDATLLQDLTEYKSSHNKGIVMAARSLIALYREVNPELLKRKDRGKAVSMSIKDFKAPVFGGGEVRGVEAIEGIELLDAEDGAGEEGDEENDGWDGWEVEEDEESDGSGGWIDVSSDDEMDLDIRLDDEMSDDEGPRGAAESGAGAGRETPSAGKTSTEEEKEEEEEEARRRRKEAAFRLATTRILTPADFAKINELRQRDKAEALTGRNKRKAPTTADTEDPEIVSESRIIGHRKKAKADYEERMASIRAGREGRERFGSRKGKGDKEHASSSTNREKRKTKAFMMIVHKRDVVSKRKMSLRDKQIALRASIEKQKKMRR